MLLQSGNFMELQASKDCENREMETLMNTVLMNIFKNKMTRKLALLLATTAGLATLAPLTAQAGDRHHDDRFGLDIRIGSDRPVRRWVPGICEDRATQVWVEPVYRTVCDQVYEQPVYRTVVDRVYCEPVYRTVCENVWVPDQFETREVVCYDRGRPYIRTERVLVSRGHRERVERRVLVTDGHYDTVERQVLVSDGRYRRVERQELLTPGHSETRAEHVEVVPGRWENSGGSGGWDLHIRN